MDSFRETFRLRGDLGESILRPHQLCARLDEPARVQIDGDHGLSQGGVVDDEMNNGDPHKLCPACQACSRAVTSLTRRNQNAQTVSAHLLRWEIGFWIPHDSWARGDGGMLSRIESSVCPSQRSPNLFSGPSGTDRTKSSCPDGPEVIGPRRSRWNLNSPLFLDLGQQLIRQILSPFCPPQALDDGKRLGQWCIAKWPRQAVERRLQRRDPVAE